MITTVTVVLIALNSLLAVINYKYGNTCVAIFNFCAATFLLAVFLR